MLIQKHHLTGAGLFPKIFLICFILVMPSHLGFAAEKPIEYISSPAAHRGVIIDARDAALCEKMSLSGARCLSVRDMLGPHKRLANFSGLLWLLGTAGLTGTEHVLVIGDQGRDKEFLAGMLYLAGQQKISVLIPALKSLPDDKKSAGTGRSKTRENVYRAAMRETHIILRSELAGILQAGNAPVILDGRTENEYWGQEIRSQRGGHLPGAQHLPATSVLPGKSAPRPIQLGAGDYAVAYGHGSYESVIYLARLATAGVKTKVLLEGWAGWASDGSLPADSATYTDKRASRRPAVMNKQMPSKFRLPFIALIILASVALIAAGYFAGRKFSK